MKATLDFDLSNPDDIIEYSIVNQSGKMYAALFEIVNNLHRDVDNYIDNMDNDVRVQDIYKVLNHMYDKINELTQGIDLTY